jgi:UDP-N-acetylmuramate dehydrogenase
LAELTTLRLGGPAARFVEAADEAALVAAVTAADRDGGRLLVLGGGSNLVVADEGVAGTVVHVATRGVEEVAAAEDDVVLRVQAGEPWEPFVARCVAGGLAGVECLSGIPGSVGATPIQNVGAYGQEVAETIVAVRVLDRATGERRELPAAACGFGYRASAFKRDPGRHVVLAVDFRLGRRGDARPIRYAELARRLDVPVGGAAPLADARAAVLELRRAKGMVLDAADRDTWSAGSFFTNPILEPAAFAAAERRALERLGPDARLPAWPEPDGRLKTSAAWLIERAGFRRGDGDPDGIAISSKHTLALTNRGAGSTRELVALAVRIADDVADAFGIALEPEPVFVGVAWPGARTTAAPR